MANKKKLKEIMDVARDLATYHQRIWDCYDEISEMLPTAEEVANASTSDLESLIGDFYGNRPPHLGAIYEEVRRRRRDGFEPEAPVELEFRDDELIEEVRSSTNRLTTFENVYHSRGHELVALLREESEDLKREVIATLPEGCWRGILTHYADRQQEIEQRASGPKV